MNKLKVNLFIFADTNKGKYTEGLSDAAKFYQSWSGYGDELAWGATWLYKATKDEKYLEKAERYYTLYGLNSRPQGFDWDSKNAGVQLLLAKETADMRYWNDFKGFMKSMINHPNKTPKGLLHLFKWGSNRHAANIVGLAVLASNSESLHAKENQNKWLQFAKQQM